VSKPLVAYYRVSVNRGKSGYAIADEQGWLVVETLEHGPRSSASWQGRG
jgi:hypothetical protein